MKKIITEQRIQFDESVLKERWEKIYQYKSLSVYDSCHVPERLAERHDNLTYERFLKYLEKGLRKIDKKYDLEFNQYMIISYRTDLKIQLDLRPDRGDRHPVAVVATILDAKKNPFNKHDEIEIYVEKAIRTHSLDPASIPVLKEASKKIGYFTIEEGEMFQYRFQDGKMHTSFEVIEVDEDEKDTK